MNSYDRLLGGGVDGLECLAVDTLDELIVDKPVMIEGLWSAKCVCLGSMS